MWETLESLTAAAERARWTTHRVIVSADGVQVTLPAATGLECRVLVGEETTTLVDFDTEIAPEFWLAEPRVERVFDGFLAQARVAGRDLVGTYWIATGADERQLSLDETLHGSAPMISRQVEAGAIRARSGAGATLGRLWVGFDPW